MLVFLRKEQSEREHITSSDTQGLGIHAVFVSPISQVIFYIGILLNFFPQKSGNNVCVSKITGGQAQAMNAVDSIGNNTQSSEQWNPSC